MSRTSHPPYEQAERRKDVLAEFMLKGSATCYDITLDGFSNREVSGHAVHLTRMGLLEVVRRADPQRGIPGQWNITAAGDAECAAWMVAA